MRRHPVGRIIFDPEDLQQKFAEVYTFCIENEIDLSVESFRFDLDDSKKIQMFDLTNLLSQEYDEDIYFTDDDEISICLPRAYDSEEVPFGYFYQFMHSAIQGSTVDDKRFISPKLALFHVNCDPFVQEKIDRLDLSVEQQWGDTDIVVSLVQGLTSYGIRLAIDGDYDKYFPPMTIEDTFIQIKSKDVMDPQTFQHIVDAYIFELESTYSLSIHPSERQTCLHYVEDATTEDDDDNTIGMRRLLKGKGISTLLKIYNASNEVDDNEFRILNYTKIIEYVSQTVIRKEMLDSILKKLYSPKVLQPDATYILQLEQLYDEHRNNKRDHQAIRLTVETCCDLTDLIDIAPIFLKKISNLKERDNKQLRTECFEELAGSISDTRNMIAHAKTNYRLKGGECPSEQLGNFADCLKLVAAQVIRWFDRQHEDSRII